KVVLVGFASATEAEVGSAELDHFAVPYSRFEGGLMAGVEVHAHAVENIWNDTFIELFDFKTLAEFSCLAAFLLGLLFLSVRPVWGSIIFIVIVAFLAVATVYLFLEHYFYFSPVALVLPL